MPRPKPTGEPLADVDATLRWLDGRRAWPAAAEDPLTASARLTLLVALHGRSGDRRYLEEAHACAPELETPDAATPMAAWALWRLACADGRDPTAARAQARRSAEAALASGRQLDPFLAHAVGQRVAGREMGTVAGELADRVELLSPGLSLDRDRDLGLMMWATHLVAGERWALEQRDRCLHNLDTLWVDPPGFFCHLPDYQALKDADANYLISVGLQAIGTWPERVWLLQQFFRYFRVGDESDDSARTHVLGCCALVPDGLLMGRGHPH